MSDNNWGGARQGAGRKPLTEINRCHELMDIAATDDDWIQVMQELIAIAKDGDAERARIRASETLMRYRFAMPKAEPPPPPEEVQQIRYIEVHIPPGCEEEIRTTDIPFPEGVGIPDEYRCGWQGGRLRVVIPPREDANEEDSAGIEVVDTSDESTRAEIAGIPPAARMPAAPPGKPSGANLKKLEKQSRSRHR